MFRLVVLAGLLIMGVWFARGAGVIRLPFHVPLAQPSLHDDYGEQLERVGLDATPVGRAWIGASTDALSRPTSLPLPAQQALDFTASAPRAWGFRVALKRGQRLEVTTAVVSTMPTQTFVDVFELNDSQDSSPEHEDGAFRGAAHEATDDREVIVRVQPELLRGGTVTVTLRANPALRFPVAAARPRDLQSIFGDPRDGGRRQHEGVDIFAKRGTPVVSATDGVVLRVGETALGGRVVWVWDPTRGLRFYYAHLDEQLVSTGELVDAGDVIGTVGNTGNARTTPPHLHFGIYERGRGAIDPFWFIAPHAVAASRATR
jgi:hypothetical protein